MKLTIRCAAYSSAGRSSATTAAAAAARPTASTTQLTRPSPRSSRRIRSAHSRSRNQSASSMLSPFLELHGLGEEAEKAVGEQQHQHREQRRQRRVHREVGAVGGALEVPVLLGARLARLLAQKIQVRALLRRKQVG